MKISKLLENPTPTSSMDNMAGGQAPHFGRDPAVLEDEQIDEMTSGATGSGSVGGGVPSDLGMQRRSKGSIFQGVKTSKKFVNSPVTEDPLKDKSLDALNQAKDAIALKRTADLEQWEKEFRQSMANKLKQKPSFEPVPVSQPGEKHSALQSRMSQLDIAIKKQDMVDKLAEKLDKIGRLTPAMQSAIDTRLHVRLGAKDNYQTLNRKLDSAIEMLQNNLSSYKIARKKPKKIRESAVLGGINNYYDTSMGYSSGTRDTPKQQPYLQQWALKINGKVDGSKIFRSEKDAIQARLNLLIKNPNARIGLVTRGGLAEDTLNEFATDGFNGGDDEKSTLLQLGDDLANAMYGSNKNKENVKQVIGAIRAKGGDVKISWNNDSTMNVVMYHPMYFKQGHLIRLVGKSDEGVAEGFNGEYDDEAGMFKNDLQTIQRVSNHLEKEIQDNENLPEWCQAKISQAKGMVVNVMDYMISQHENGEIETVDEGVNDNPKVDLSPNYPNYATLVGEFIGMRRNRALFRIIAAELKPGVRETEKIFKARTTNTPISIELGKVKNRTVLEAELSEESLLAKQLARQLELFNKSDDRELGSKPVDKEIIAREAAHVPSMVDRIEKAITVKLTKEHPEVIQQYGKQIVQDAIANVAVYHRHMRQVTESDIDEMITEIIQQLNRHLQMREDENK